MTMKINGMYLREREPDATVAGCIEIFENVWPNPQHKIDVIENECLNPDSGISWQKAGTVGSGAYQNIRTNSIMDLTYLSDITNNDGGTSMGRSVSALCYLNDNYEGGEIEFVNFKIKIKPLAGMVILFPSNYAYRHIAHPVTSGTKYAIVTWIKDRSLQ